MNKSIYFIGDPGPSKNELLSSLRDANIKPARIGEETDPVVALEEEGSKNGTPVALIVGADVEDPGELVSRLRERESLQSFPIIFALRDGGEESIRKAIEAGADDFIVHDCPRKFEALIVTLEDADAWKVFRAPKGIAVVAEAGREERVKIAQVLRRNGFDVGFAGNADELQAAVASSKPRIVVSSAEIAEEVFNSPERTSSLEKKTPWVVVNDGQLAPPDPADVPGHLPAISLVNRNDGLDGITFVTNELLTPAPANVRKSKRLVYGTPITFGLEEKELCFQGYSYNISLGGLFVRTITPMPMGTVLHVRMKAPFAKGELEAKAQVVWVSEYKGMGASSSPPGMGLQFVEWCAPDKAAYEVGYELLLAKTENRQATNKMDVDLAADIETTLPPPTWWSPRISA